MDITKTMIAINEFQNAVNRVRALPTLISKADEVWQELSTLNEAELKARIAQRGELEGEIQALQSTRDELKTSVKALRTRLSTDTSALNETLDAKRQAFESEHAARVKAAQGELETLTNEIAERRAEQQHELSSFSKKRDSLAGQIEALKNQFKQASSIIHA